MQIVPVRALMTGILSLALILLSLLSQGYSTIALPDGRCRWPVIRIENRLHVTSPPGTGTNSLREAPRANINVLIRPWADPRARLSRCLRGPYVHGH